MYVCMYRVTSIIESCSNNEQRQYTEVGGGGRSPSPDDTDAWHHTRAGCSKYRSRQSSHHPEATASELQARLAQCRACIEKYNLKSTGSSKAI